LIFKNEKTFSSSLNKTKIKGIKNEGKKTVWKNNKVKWIKILYFIILMNDILFRIINLKCYKDMRLFLIILYILLWYFNNFFFLLILKIKIKSK